MLKKSSQGFTILEVVIVVILMGIIGVIAVPSAGLVRKQEVKKLAKEMCLDITTQRMKAITTSGANYSVELVHDAGLAYYNGYKLSTIGSTTGSAIRENNKDNSKNIHITMQTSGAAIGVTSPATIQFDHYGYMMDTSMPTSKDIAELTISIMYNEAKTDIIFDGVTGHYTIQ